MGEEDDIRPKGAAVARGVNRRTHLERAPPAWERRDVASYDERSRLCQGGRRSEPAARAISSRCGVRAGVHRCPRAEQGQPPAPRPRVREPPPPAHWVRRRECGARRARATNAPWRARSNANEAPGAPTPPEARRLSPVASGAQLACCARWARSGRSALKKAGSGYRERATRPDCSRSGWRPVA